MEGIEYRLLRQVDDLHKVVQLQQLVRGWGNESDALISYHMLVSLMRSGAPIIGAFDGELLVGFSVGFFGLHNIHSERPALANLKIASKRMGVHPDYRNSGIGLQLKREQRNFAKQQGIQLITWTFDPLKSRNAHLYIRRLGGMVREYVPDYYGTDHELTDITGHSDRFVCEWWISSRRVEERLNGNRPNLTLKQYLEGGVEIINPTSGRSDGLPEPYVGSVTIGGTSMLMVEIPADENDLTRDETLERIWRSHSRLVLGAVFEMGYIVTDFLHEEYEGRARSFYLMGFDGV